MSISWACAGTSFPFSEQVLSVFHNMVSCHLLWESYPHPLHPIPGWVRSLAHSTLLIPVDFLLCVVTVYSSDIYIRGRKCVLSSVFPGHNIMPTCTIPFMNAIWVSDELARASLWKTLVGLWRRGEVCVYVNLVAYRLLHSLELAPK